MAKSVTVEVPEVPISKFENAGSSFGDHLLGFLLLLFIFTLVFFLYKQLKRNKRNEKAVARIYYRLNKRIDKIAKDDALNVRHAQTSAENNAMLDSIVLDSEKDLDTDIHFTSSQTKKED